MTILNSIVPALNIQGLFYFHFLLSVYIDYRYFLFDLENGIIKG